MTENEKKLTQAVVELLLVVDYLRACMELSKTQKEVANKKIVKVFTLLPEE